MFCLQAFIRQDDKKDIAGNSVIAHVVICANQYGTGDDHCPERVVFRGLRAFYPIFQSGNQCEALFIRALFLPCAGQNQSGRLPGGGSGLRFGYPAQSFCRRRNIIKELEYSDEIGFLKKEPEFIKLLNEYKIKKGY